METAWFLPFKGRTVGPDFYDALALCCRVISHDMKITIHASGSAVELVGDYVINNQGKLKRVKP